MKPAARLNEVGQSAWLDLIGRKLIHSGELLRMVQEDGIRGVTANPSIFEKAIVESDEYDDQLKKLIEQGKPPLQLYEAIAFDDVRAACDVLRPTFDRLQGADGFVSLEVSPYIARDTKATVEEAKRFWKAVDRPNLFIKIPANPEGIPAIRQATAAGISVNITLIFSVRVYAQVIDAYFSGLEERVAKGLPISQIHSVASFFVSRVDTAVDKLLEEKGARELLGKIAVANAKEAYQAYLQSISSPRWKALAAKGATRQRPLWASTGTKNKAYSDVLYVDPLIGKDTVNTLPMQTLQAFNDHGKVAETVTQGVAEARAQLARLGELGIDLEKVCAQLTDQGLDLFSKALDGLLHAIAARAAAENQARKSQLRESMGRRKEDAAAGLKAASDKKVGTRLWSQDAALWGAHNVAASRLGWLHMTKFCKEHASEITAFGKEAAKKFRHCLLLGMGGSSLAPEVIARVLGKREGGLDLRVLDSTAPDAVRAATKGFDLRKTLFLVSSKSGGTTEVDSFYRHFRSKVPEGGNFAAITDPGSPLEKRAKDEGFLRTFLNPPDIGGR
ncbi:MAG: bifunctional transaldolase/phosoglucose isomerase, partial [Myxococcales bacterium]